MAGSEAFEISRTLVRNVARDGLMEDGKEELLRCKFIFVLYIRPELNHTSGSHSR